VARGPLVSRLLQAGGIGEADNPAGVSQSRMATNALFTDRSKLGTTLIRERCSQIRPVFQAIEDFKVQPTRPVSIAAP